MAEDWKPVTQLGKAVSAAPADAGNGSEFEQCKYTLHGFSRALFSSSSMMLSSQGPLGRQGEGG